MAGAPRAAAPTSASGEALPVGDLPGWRQTFVDDFTVGNVKRGSWPGPYQEKWGAYPEPWRDTSGKGIYSPERTLSVSGGLLDIYLHSEGGQPYVAAPQPRLFPGKSAGTGQRYGRYVVRFRADPVPGYKTAWLLWPDDDQWPEGGEIDFPEGRLVSSIHGFVHEADSEGGKDSFDTNVTYRGWHTATTEWSPGRVKFYLDKKLIGTSTTKIPKGPMHWVLQTETDLDAATSDRASGHVQIDWVAAYSRVAR